MSDFIRLEWPASPPNVHYDAAGPTAPQAVPKGVYELAGDAPAASLHSWTNTPPLAYGTEPAGLEAVHPDRPVSQTTPTYSDVAQLLPAHGQSQAFELQPLRSPAASRANSIMRLAASGWQPRIIQPEGQQFCIEPDLPRSVMLNLNGPRDLEASPSPLAPSQRGHAISYYRRHKKAIWWTVAASLTAVAGSVGVFLGLKFGLHHATGAPATASTTTSSTHTVGRSSTAFPTPTTLPTTSPSPSVSVSASASAPAQGTTSQLPPTTTSGSSTSTQSYTAASFTGMADRTDFDCASDNGKAICYGTGWVAYDATTDGHVGAFVLWPQLTGSDRSSTYNATVPPLPASGAQQQTLALSALDDGLQAPGCSKNVVSSLTLNADETEAIGTLYFNYTYTGDCGSPPPDCGCVYSVKVGLDGVYAKV